MVKQTPQMGWNVTKKSSPEIRRRAGGWRNAPLREGCSSGRTKLVMFIAVLVILIAAISFLIAYFLTRQPADTATSRRESAPRLTNGTFPTPPRWEPRCPAYSTPADRAKFPASSRYDCYPELVTTVSEARCKARGCCWLPVAVAATSVGTSGGTRSGPTMPIHRVVTNVTVTSGGDDEYVPQCVYPENYGYVVTGAEKQFLDGWEMDLTRMAMPSRVGDEATVVRVRVEMQTPNRLRIKLYNPVLEEKDSIQEPRIPVEKVDLSKQSPRRGKQYAVSYSRMTSPFGFQVRRVDTGVALFDTSVAGFTFAKQFMQLSTKLPSKFIYGLGSNNVHSRGQESSSWQTRSLFAGEKIESKYISSHGGHPFYLCLENGGKAHGVLLHNDYPMDMVLQPTPALTYRVLGGSLDFYIFLGPTPEDVIKQYNEAVGRPFLPPYWTLGFQINHMEAKNLQSVKDSLRDVGKSNVSYDVVSLAGEYMNNHLDFTVSHKNFSNLLIFAEEMTRENRRLDVDVDPAISSEQPSGTYLPYDEALRMALFVNSSFEPSPLIARSKSGKSAYVDFGHPDVVRWWTRQLERLRSIVRFHSLSLVENYPLTWDNGSNAGCFSDDLNNPPYALRALQKLKLYWRTLCMDSWQFQGKKRQRHYATHNKYGHNMALATFSSLSTLLSSERRVSIVSQSTFIGSGKYSGFWEPNNTRSWDHLQQSITTMLNYNLYGIPLVGSPICGTRVNVEDDELCSRWIQLGAFYPLARMIQDPIFCEKTFARSAREAMSSRYSLLPYLYTLFFKASTEGGTVARAMFHEFSDDKTTYNISTQFMWGPALMIAPVTVKGLRLLEVYLPKGFWYIYQTGGKISSIGESLTMEAPIDRVLLLVRGGHILPTQPAGMTTYQSRQNKMHLVVALNEKMSARGHLYWDDGEKRDSFHKNDYIIANFTVSQDKLTVTGKKMKPVLPSTITSAYFDSVDIMGLPYKPSVVAILGTVGVLGSHQFQWDKRNNVLQLRQIIIPLTETVEIRWRWTS